jgi:archaellum component FlaG (FlaF/FlaG flagellin family)
MKKRFFLFATILFCLIFNLNANDLWSTQKKAGALSVCYRGISEMYCAGSMDKKVKEIDLRHYLSVFLYFSQYEVNKSNLALHPGIKRVVKGARPGDGKDVIKKVYDYLLREGKRRSIMLSAGKDKVSQKVMTECDQITEIESINWPKYIDSVIDTVVCTSEGKVNLSFKVTNSMKKDFSFKGEEVELRVMGGRYEILSVGSVKESKITLKPGETKAFEIDIPITGDMVPSTRYSIIPFIRNIQVSKEGGFVVCEANN